MRFFKSQGRSSFFGPRIKATMIVAREGVLGEYICGSPHFSFGLSKCASGRVPSMFWVGWVPVLRVTDTPHISAGNSPVGVNYIAFGRQ